MKPFALIVSLCATPLSADPASIVAIEARPSGQSWTFSVTLSHGDTEWDDYADGWRVELADGTVLGTRPLVHPHETEQPFTRSQSGIIVPDGTAGVSVRASTSVEGWAKDATPFALTR